MSQNASEILPFERPLIAGTRGSALARWQTDFVIAALAKIAPSLEIQVKVISTTGDRDKNRPIAELGARGVFTNELENALRRGEIDFAVHSLKDLPTGLANDVPVAAVLERADARDVLVSRGAVGFRRLPNGARIGTSSTRRTAQLLALRPDLVILPIRGNVDTRLKKAMGTEYDAIVLAAAGVLRLGRGDAITDYFSVDEVTPDPGQGALAVQVQVNNAHVYALVAQINHAPTEQAVTAERAFLQALGGGCDTPMATYAEWSGAEMVLRGMVAAVDGTQIVRGELRGSGENPQALGAALAQQLIVSGAGEIIANAGRAPTAASDALRGKRIVITRAAGQAEELAEKIRAQGGEPLFYPTIAIAPLTDFRALDSHLTSLTKFDWVVFTSVNGVRAVQERLETLGLDLSALAQTRVAAIGTGTAQALQTKNVRVDFVPSRFLGAQLARELPAEHGNRVLLLRADLASDELAEGLSARGVLVTDMDAYRTVPASPPPLDWNSVDAITFTSASTVQNAWALLNEHERKQVAACDIFCIGPVTAATVKVLGWQVTATAREHTMEGLVAALVDYYQRSDQGTSRQTLN